MPNSRKRGRSPESSDNENARSEPAGSSDLQEIFFDGTIKYHSAFIECTVACDELLQTANALSEALVFGFSMEWPFNFETYHGETAVLSICPSLDLAYLFHIIEWKNLPNSLCDLLSHNNVRIVGDNIENKIRKLSQEFPLVDCDAILPHCLDVGLMANSVLHVKKKWYLEKLVGHVLNLKMIYNKKMRFSKWDLFPLTNPQQENAALNSYVPFVLYHHLKSREKLQILESNDSSKHPTNNNNE